MNKSLILGIIAILLYAWIVWPEKEANLDKELSKTEREATQNQPDPISRSPERKPKIALPKRPKSSVNTEEDQSESDEYGQDELEQLKDESPEAHAYIVENNRLIKEGFGQTPPISEDNEQVRSVKEAIETGKYPERRSVAIKAPPFNTEKFQNDSNYRQNYMSQSVPSRAHQSLDPGEGIPVTSRTSDYFQEVEQGKKITLSVKSASNMPITFTSFALGKFGNGLTSQTVLADSEGHAEVEFYGVSGTAATTGIAASSPAASGIAKFQVFTTLKKNTND